MVHGVPKSQTRLSDFTFTSHFHALEKEMATPSSVLAWRIPGTGSLVGCRLRGHTESDTTDVTQQQQQQRDRKAPTAAAFSALALNGCATIALLGLPGGSAVENPPASAGDTGLVPAPGRSPGQGNGNPLQYSCLEIPWMEEPGRLQSMGSQRVRHD